MRERRSSPSVVRSEAGRDCARVPALPSVIEKIYWCKKDVKYSGKALFFLNQLCTLLYKRTILGDTSLL